MISAIHRIELALGSDVQLVVVGGAVRDKLLGRDIGDWDLATSLVPEEVMVRARAFGLKAIPTGLKHGTVTLIVGGQSFEVTTFRGDGIYLDGRHPQAVTFGVSLEQDLARRDFTINAMALPVSALEKNDWANMIVDLHGGLRDLERRIIRTVGDPLVRFREDGLRALRACRFSAMLGFDVDTAIIEAIPKMLDVIIKTSIERVFTELTKLLCTLEPERGLDVLVSTKLIELWLPELCPLMSRCTKDIYGSRTLWQHTVAVVRKVPVIACIRWAAMLHDCGMAAINIQNSGALYSLDHYELASADMAKRILVRMRASNALISAVVALIRNHNINVNSDWNDSDCRRFLKRVAEDSLNLNQLTSFILVDQEERVFGKKGSCLGDKYQKILTKLKTLAVKNPPLTVRELAIDSKNLMEIAQRRGGPWLGVLKRFLLELVIDDPALNEAEMLRDIVKDQLETILKR